ncbi:hypothetical protein AX16_009606 [Volvariella volvacea WC 439]|nr:hypothetical protein AX16_009606 [Volvariella volvacea WC 439]
MVKKSYQLTPEQIALSEARKAQKLLKADILCLQEVDRTDKLIPVLENAGYLTRYASGPGKKHGLLLAWKRDRYTERQHAVIYYDDAETRTIGGDTFRQGKTFKTRNIGLISSLVPSSNTGDTFVLATTHLFWHPKYTYERIRQVSILLREVIKFQSEHGLDQSPAFLCGDFNFPPDDPAYSLLVGEELLPTQLDGLNASYVIHASVDPTVPAHARVAGDDEESTDPDKTKTSARPATPEDGLLSIEELQDVFRALPRLLSAYDEGLGRNVGNAPKLDVFHERGSLPKGRRGSFEPAYSSYTYWWQSMIGAIVM